MMSSARSIRCASSSATCRAQHSPDVARAALRERGHAAAPSAPGDRRQACTASTGGNPLLRDGGARQPRATRCRPRCVTPCWRAPRGSRRQHGRSQSSCASSRERPSRGCSSRSPGRPKPPSRTASVSACCGMTTPLLPSGMSWPAGPRRHAPRTAPPAAARESAGGPREHDPTSRRRGWPTMPMAHAMARRCCATLPSPARKRLRSALIAKRPRTIRRRCVTPTTCRAIERAGCSKGCRMNAILTGDNEQRP